MRKWIVAASSSALLLLGLSAPEEKVVATSGAQIKVLKTESGYVLEVSWSGGQPEDVAVLGIASPKWEVGQRAWPMNPLTEGEQVIWVAGEAGTKRIPVAPTEVDERYSGTDGRMGWTAAVTFVAGRIEIPIHEQTKDQPSRGKVVPRVGLWKRNVTFSANEIGREPRVLRPKGSQERESIFVELKPQVLWYEYDFKTETTGPESGPTPVAYKGAEDRWNPRSTHILVAW